MRRLRSLLVAGAVLLAAAPFEVRAQEAKPTPPPPPAESVPTTPLPPPEFTLVADEVTYDGSRDIYEATGNVRITQADGRVLTTDWLVFNATTRTGIATGDVRVVDAQNTVRAEFVAVDLNSTVSVAVRGSMENPLPGFAVKGEVIQRTGVDTFKIENGTFTTCRCPPEEGRRPWEIEAKQADVEIGGYAVGHDLWFKTLGVPVLYLPWLVFPVKTDRQTGFLMPTFASSSRNGTELGLPFFWALSEGVNATLEPQWISQRGWKPKVTSEYVFGETAYGDGGASILPDDRKVKNSNDSFFSDNRWGYWLRHQQPLAPGIQFGADVNQISDNEYTVDFRDLGHDAGNQRQLETSTWLTAAREGFYGNGLLSMNDDLQNPNDLDRDGFFLQRLPDIRAGSLPRTLFGLPIKPGLETRITNFVQTGASNSIYGVTNAAGDPNAPAAQVRPVNNQFFDTGEDGRFTGGEPASNGAFNHADNDRDDFGNPNAVTQTEGDGVFQEGELLAADGQRYDFYPTLTLPLQLGIFDLLTEGGVRETLYFPSLGGNANRTLYTARGDLRTLFGRSFAVGTVPLQHIMEPRVAFAAVFAPDQSDNPLFIPEPRRLEQRLIDGDIRLLTRDPSDRVPDTRLIQFQLLNRLYGPPRDDAAPARLYGQLNVGTGYDFLSDAFTRVFALAELRPSREYSVAVDAGWDPEARHLQDMTASAGWESDAGNQLRVGYRYKRNPSPIFESFLGRGSIFDAKNERTDKINQVNLSTYIIATQNLELFAEGFTSLETTGTDGGRVGVVVISSCKCWDLMTELEKQARPNDTRFSVQVRLTGLGERSRASDVDRRKYDRAAW
jgi:lipopolysaccharide assembly outer membrane protein LptD (OstA)